MDSRGHGRSRALPHAQAFLRPGFRQRSNGLCCFRPRPDEQPYFTIHDMACDAAALLDHLGIEKAILFGFSDGANIALEFACCFPERTLAVISASGNALPHGLRLPVRLGTQMTGCALALFKDFLPDGTLRQHLTNRLQLNTLLTDSPNLFCRAPAADSGTGSDPCRNPGSHKDLSYPLDGRADSRQPAQTDRGRHPQGSVFTGAAVHEVHSEFLLNSQQIPLESQNEIKSIKK